MLVFRRTWLCCGRISRLLRTWAVPETTLFAGQSLTLKVTSIYGLFDCRSTGIIMYVGKGGDKRAQKHWKEFISKGTAMNSKQRHWFEKLKAEGVEPSWKFLEENVENWQRAEQLWIAALRGIGQA